MRNGVKAHRYKLHHPQVNLLPWNTMPIPISEVLDVFESYTSTQNIPSRFIDLRHFCLVDIETVRKTYRVEIESISEADIERHTSYVNQRRVDVIRTIVQSVVKYAVLSHTWLLSDREFLYRDMASNAPRIGAGWRKLEQFCNLARNSFQCRFAWADTACIDYENQLERQLLTQSQFYWHRNAYVGIAYLWKASDSSDMGDDPWFSRGFTLTEILAPVRMKFYGVGWKALNNDYVENDKADRGFLKLLSEASGIPLEDLRSFWPGPDRIRCKLSWASKRETAMVEDKAYSLLALFGSRIPVNYGEREKAFTRLMIDVIPRSKECDIFAWAGPCSRHHPGIPDSPAGFGEQHRDRQLDSSPHHYRLCGDRSLTIDSDCLRIRVIILEINLPLDGVASYKPVTTRHPAHVSEVTLLNQDLDPPIQMVVGVVDYSWTNSPDEGMLYKGSQYFCFVLYKSHRNEGWKKLLTRKVVFLINDQELVQKPELLCIYQTAHG